LEGRFFWASIPKEHTKTRITKYEVPDRRFRSVEDPGASGDVPNPFASARETKVITGGETLPRIDKALV
jgi:hypothetical protein